MKNMDVAPGGGNNLNPKDSGDFEEENVWLQDWIREELAHGEVWQRQYEELLGHQAQLFSLLQTKSFVPLEKKTQALQEDLEEVQEILQEYKNQRRQCQLQIQKQEKANRRMALTVKELEKKVFKQHLEEQSKNDILKELKMQGHELKRHLSEWQAKQQTKNDQIKQRHQKVEKLSNIIQGLSLKSEELRRSIILLEDRVMEAQQEEMLFQKEISSGQGGTSSWGFLWEEQDCDQMAQRIWKRLSCLELSRTNSKEQFFSRSILLRTLRGVWRLIWALVKVLFLILLLVLVFHYFHGRFSSRPCAPRYSTPSLYIQPKEFPPSL